MVHVGDCVEWLDTLPASSVDSIVTDPPYGLGFQGARWDALPPGEDWALACLRVLRPGGHLLAAGATRTVHRLTTAIEDAGFEIRDTVSWLYWSGYPKSTDIAKTLDYRRDDRPQIRIVTAWIAAARDAAGLKNSDIDHYFGFNNMAGHWTTQKQQPTLPRADQWPALQRLLGVQAPPDVAELWQQLHQRVGTVGNERPDRVTNDAHEGGSVQFGRTVVNPGRPVTPEAQAWEGWGTALKPAQEPFVLARKRHTGPVGVNLVQHGTGALNVAACKVHSGDLAWPGPDEEDRERWPANVYACKKASRAEKERGCDDLPLVEGLRNHHPTAKPVRLMRWLCRLVTRPGGLVVDPFTGSGTTGVAAALEGMRFAGAELSEEYTAIARARIEHAQREPRAWTDTAPAPPPQLSLFRGGAGRGKLRAGA